MARATEAQKEDTRAVALALAGYRWWRTEPFILHAAPAPEYEDGSRYCCGLGRDGDRPWPFSLAVCVHDGAYLIDRGNDKLPSHPRYRGGRIVHPKLYPTERDAKRAVEMLVLRALRRASPV
jgi:hypothetical protein